MIGQLIIHPKLRKRKLLHVGLLRGLLINSSAKERNSWAKRSVFLHNLIFFQVTSRYLSFKEEKKSIKRKTYKREMCPAKDVGTEKS